MPEETTPTESKSMQVANWLIQKALGGVRPLSGAEELAREYLSDSSYKNNDSRVESLINFETSKNFVSGFATGLGGFATLSIAIPAALGASWLLQARMAAAIAKIYGHDLNEDRVKTLILCVIIGQKIEDICKLVGIQIVKKSARIAIEKQLSAEALKRINQAVGYRLLTKAGGRGIVNLTKLVPVVGGVVGGTFDAVTCRIAARTAQKVFRQE